MLSACDSCLDMHFNNTNQKSELKFYELLENYKLLLYFFKVMLQNKNNDSQNMHIVY